MPPPIAIFTFAIIWLSGIGFFAFAMKESAEESGSARTRSALVRIHLSISTLAMSVASKGPGVQPKLPAPSISVCDHRCMSASLASGTPITCAKILAASGPASAEKRSTISPRGSGSRYAVASFAYSGAQTDSIVLGIKAGIIAMRSVRCSSWSLRISVRARKTRFIGVFGSLELNNAALSLTYLVSAALVKGAAYRFNPQYRCFASQAPVDRIGIAREFRDRDGLVQGSQARGRHGMILSVAGQHVPKRRIIAGANQRNQPAAAPTGTLRYADVRHWPYSDIGLPPNDVCSTLQSVHSHRPNDVRCGCHNRTRAPQQIGRWSAAERLWRMTPQARTDPKVIARMQQNGIVPWHRREQEDEHEHEIQ
jgi:hypothetical protein